MTAAVEELGACVLLFVPFSYSNKKVEKRCERERWGVDVDKSQLEGLVVRLSTFVGVHVGYSAPPQN